MKNMIVTLCLLLIALPYFTMASGKPTLMSTNKKCHDERSPDYDKVKDTGSNNFVTMEECIDKGGSVPYRSSVLYAKEKRYEQEKRKEKAIEDGDKLEVAAADNEIKKAEENLQFGGWDFNLAIALLNYGSDEFIDGVTIENKEIRVDHVTSNQGALMLEAHHYWVEQTSDFVWGWGPFFSIGLAKEEGGDPLSTYGAGLMAGIKNGDSTFNVGVGYYIDTDFVKFRKGIKEGDQTEETDPQKLLQRTDEDGLMIVFTATF
ncbi:hypothetical protein [Thalassomonas sp. RHCl1]|uniref:hypothetical protein n=1 Tax=Thalassomonas sp. RHCl1 TaxID=2995320 RepID=UPI00248D1E17|nr:hypothetical protein [Thalassomonas sp. RHCl1]